jgi:hypothetical protein
MDRQDKLVKRVLQMFKFKFKFNTFLNSSKNQNGGIKKQYKFQNLLSTFFIRKKTVFPDLVFSKKKTSKTMKIK